MKKLLTVFSVAAALLSAVSCEDIMGVLGEIELPSGTKEITITPATVQIKAEGGTATIAFTAPAVWSASSSADWLTVDPSAGTSGECVVTITAQANTGAERSSTVVVESSGVKATATVTQAAAEGTGPETPPVDSTATADKWYLIGTFNDWNVTTSLEMKVVSEGVYTVDATFPENTEFKFLKDQDPDWKVNLGCAQWDSGNVSPAITAGETISLVQDGANILFVPGGDVTITLDVNNNTAVLTGGNTPQDPPQTEGWSVIGTIFGTNWDTDFDMDCGGDFYHALIYYEDGQEFKIRSNHSWDSPEYGYGPIIMPEPSILTAVSKGLNMTLPWTGWWDVYFVPAREEIQFFPHESDLDWQYFLNPDGSVADVTFTSEQFDTSVTGKIKYYEVNGVRTCKTETNGGVLGNNREWYFVWYTDSDRIKLPLQLSGFVHEGYGEATVMSPYYYYGVYAKEHNPNLGDYFNFVENYTKYPEAYYDGNGGFYFGVEWYLFMDYGMGFNMESYDVVAEGNGYDRHDYSGHIEVGPAIQGTRDIKFVVGKDITSVRYVLFDQKIDNDDDALEVVMKLVEGSIEYNVIDEFAVDANNQYYSVLPYTAEVPGYHTIVAIGLDATREWFFWYYYWFYLDPAEDTSGLTWTSLGTGSFTDDIFTIYKDAESLTWDVEVEQCIQEPNRFRMVYPYDGKFAYNEEGDWLTDKSYDIEIVVFDEKHVYIRPQETGVVWSYGMTSIASVAGYKLENGYSMEGLDESMYGTCVDGVISFPVHGLLVSFADYDGGAWYKANANGAFKLVLPETSAAGAPAAKKAVAPASKSVRNAGKAVSDKIHGKGGKAVKPRPTLERAM